MTVNPPAPPVSSVENIIKRKPGRPRKTVPAAIFEGNVPEKPKTGIDFGRVAGVIFAIYAAVGIFRLYRGTTELV